MPTFLISSADQRRPDHHDTTIMNLDELLAPEDMAENIQAEITQAYREKPSFRGQEIYPLLRHSKLCLGYGNIRGVLPVFEDLFFVWLHTKRGGATFGEDVEKVMPLLVNPAKLHVAVMDWYETLCADADDVQADAILTEAKTVRDKALGLVAKTEVTVNYEDGGPKASGAGEPSPTTTATGSASSEPNSDTAPSTSLEPFPFGEPTAFTTPGTTAGGPVASVEPS